MLESFWEAFCALLVTSGHLFSECVLGMPFSQVTVLSAAAVEAVGG